MLFLPARLTAYMSVSAARTSSWALAGGLEQTSTPMLKVTGH